MKIQNSFTSSLVIVTFVGLLFGHWFASLQIQAVNPAGFTSYPKFYFYLTMLKCLCSILIIFFISAWVLMHISRNLHPTLIAYTFLPLCAVKINIPLMLIAILILIMQFFLVLTYIEKKDYLRLRKLFLFDALVLILFSGLHFFLSTRYSPIKFDYALISAEGYYTAEVAVLAPLFRAYLAAKQFAFSYVDHAQWAGIMNPPVTLSSTLLQLLTFTLDLPSISYEHFHKVFLFLHYSLLVIGSFGFYLFLKYAAKIDKLFSLLGGYLYTFGSYPLLGLMLSDDCGVFLSSYCVFPYALLFIVLAFERNSVFLAMGAAVALAAQFFIYAPHPEGAMYSLLSFLVFTLSLQILSPQLSISRRIILGLTAIVAFFSLISYEIFPIIIDRWMQNMYVFSHTTDISPAPITILYRYILILECAFILPLPYYVFKQKISVVYAASGLLALVSLGLIYLTSDVSVMLWLLNNVHIGFHFWYIWRFGLFFYAAVLTLSIFTLQALLEMSMTFLVKYKQRILVQA